MLEKSHSSSMMRDPCKTGIDRVVAWRDNAMFGSEHRSVVLRIDSGIVAISLFKIDVPSSSKGVGLGSEFSRTEMDNEVESGKVFRPMCLLTCEDFGCGEVLEILVIGDHINGVTRTFEIVSPLFECFVDS